MRRFTGPMASLYSAIRADPARTARWALLAALAWLVLRPPFFPLLGNTVTLLGLRSEKAALRKELDEYAAENARLRGRLVSLKGSDPFVLERLRRRSGLSRPGEFDYAAVAESAHRANPPCPPHVRRPE